MSIDPISTAGQVQGAPTEFANANAAALDYTAFLRLLVAQIEYQDPLQPIDSTEYVAQLATFSQVEQSLQTNKKLDSLLIDTRFAAAEALIGQTVTSPDGKISGDVASIRITSDGTTAMLSSGYELLLTTGVVISREGS